MKTKILCALALIGVVAPHVGLAEESTSSGGHNYNILKIYPEAGNVDSLTQISISLDNPKKYGAFVYMPSLYSINDDGSLGAEVSACELIEESARGKEMLRFKILNPPSYSGNYALLIKNNSFSLLPVGEDEVDFGSQEDVESDMPQKVAPLASRGRFVNYPINLNSDTLRILHISNSYGGNLLQYVDALARAADLDLSKVLVERLMYSGASFKNWCDVEQDKNDKSYSFYKMAGDLTANVAGSEAEKYDGSKFRKMMSENHWDLIFINQASLYAPYCEKWDSAGLGGFLPELLDIIRKYQPEVPIGALLIHSYAEWYESNSPRWSTTQRWEKIRDSVEWLKDAYDIDFVVPYGTAIQNLRLTGYNNIFDLTGDGTHLASGLPQYAAGCCYFETIFGPRYMQTVWGNPLRMPEPEWQFQDKYAGCVIPVDDEAAETAQKAAFLAAHNMFELRNPDLADLSEYVYGEPLNRNEYMFAFNLTTDSVLRPNSHRLSSIYTPTGILIGKDMTEEEWQRLPKGLYIRNGEKIYKSY